MSGFGRVKFLRSTVTLHCGGPSLDDSFEDASDRGRMRREIQARRPLPEVLPNVVSELCHMAPETPV